jgi:GAF domain-containing protein
VDAGAIKAAAAASVASYRSFADATRSVLDLLERLMPGTTLYLAHLDRTHAVHRVVDTRGGVAFGLRSNLATPLAESYDHAMVEDRAPRLCNDLGADPVYADVEMQRRAPAGSYLGVPLELSDGARVGALAALAAEGARFRPDDEQLFAMLARVLAYELERESNERDLKRLNDSLRDHARGMGAISRVVRVLAGGEDGPPRRLPRGERDGRRARRLPPRAVRARVRLDGDERRGDAAVTIQPRAETTARAFTARESYFVPDARSHPALGAAARRRRRPPAPRCSSRCSATARSAAC